MRKLSKLAEDPGDVFSLCISRVRDADLKTRLTAVRPSINAAASAFENAVTSSSLHTLVAQSTGGVTQDEMIAVYKSRMVESTSPGRVVYDAILALPAHGRCPLCGQRVVSTLDHHLPKTQHPALVVVPANLVPCCKDCNHAKGETLPISQGEQPLHPYFDDFDDGVWLTAAVDPTEPPTITFAVQRPSHWPQVRGERIRNHFRLFKLASLYASHAGEELGILRPRLRRLSEKVDASEIRDYLNELANDHAALHANSWQSATYTALAGSHWYCSGGFDWAD